MSRQSTLEREIKKQQGQLADLNLAWDNFRLQKSPTKIREEILEYQEKNAHQRQKIEIVFSDHNQNHSAAKEVSRSTSLFRITRKNECCWSRNRLSLKSARGSYVCMGFR